MRDDQFNAFIEEHLTVFGDHISAQFRDTVTLDGEPDPTLILHHPDGAPKSSENGRPYILHAADARLLRDLLIAAAKRGLL
ncbi:hypothetical protein SEA_TRIPL3T_59 [Mycobacterium phage Tripl3t]|nr:hypothetical protein SEA_TRIPL3T_59 [Mycobacterium phage Tripl3t]UJE15525.1 hypothetical protein SEA_DUSSY_59 [Mycobacterium phage Dussy]UJQ86979.1 hypothetical protein SEA_ABBYSHOES_60 [Mycobacterium phage Abbyshoes]UVD39654.1 hypothetical protein SEA_KENMECH_62 [Mycobacterium phage Kenmech]